MQRQGRQLNWSEHGTHDAILGFLKTSLDLAQLALIPYTAGYFAESAMTGNGRC
jgi:hypothetical protein